VENNLRKSRKLWQTPLTVGQPFAFVSSSMAQSKVKRLQASLYIPAIDVQSVELAFKLSKAPSLSAFLMRLLLAEVRRIEAEHFGTPAERQRAAVLSLFRNGCASLEDVKSVFHGLMTEEVVAIVFALEQDGYLEKRVEKRGRTPQWYITEQGKAKIQEKGLYV
jgi:hypothetical protein